MNTRASVYSGWVFFTLCGATGYYFAKRSINADRHERQRLENEKTQRRNRQIAAATHNRIGGSPSDTQAESSQRPDGSSRNTPPSRNDEEPRSGQGGRPPGEADSKYESQRPFKSRKGDRLS